MLLRATLFFCCLLAPLFTTAQLTQTKFGQNRLQYKEFSWRYYSTNNFDIYFYDDGQQLAKQTADFMEEEYERLTDVLGYAPYSKTKIFLYNSIADMQQSNVGVNENKYTVGGQTNFVKSHVQVAFPGTLREYRQELIYQVSLMLITDMMFGGSLTDIFQSSYLMTLPEWFIDGAARYVAYGWDEEMDDFMREQLADGQSLKINRLQGREAGLAGQSIWNFIAEKYGYANISNILNYTRIIRNEETAISNTLGMPFKRFMMEWRTYYTEMAQTTRAAYKHPENVQVIAERKQGLNKYNSVALSPDGKLLAYTENKQGRYHIRVYNLETGKEETLLKTGYRVLDQEADDTIPLVAWQSQETLGIVGVEHGNYVLYLHSLRSGHTSTQTIGRISQVNDFNFSPNGKVLVMSAEKNGQNDIYLYSISRNTLRAITNDVYDDITPSFLPGSNDILFSSNRITDSLQAGSQSLGEISTNYNLFIYNIDTTDQVLSRITNTLSKDYRPHADSLGNVYFLSDQRGIVNLFRYNLQDSLYKQLTAYSTSIEDYSLSPAVPGGLAYIAMREKREQVLYVNGWQPGDGLFTNPTPRQQVKQAKYVWQKRRSRLAQTDTTRSILPPLQSAPADSLPDSLALSDTLTGAGPLQVPPDSLFQPSPDTVQQEPETGLIDTDNYVFESENGREETAEGEAPERERDSFLTRYRQLRRQNNVRGPFKQETRFMFSSLVTSIAIDPLRSSLGSGGVGFVLEGEVTDMLQDHKLYGGVLAMTDLRSGDLYLQYEYLKYLLDFGIRYDRRVVLEPFSSIDKNRYVLNKVDMSVALPLNVSSRISVGPVLAQSRFLVISPVSVLSPSTGQLPFDHDIWYGGGKVEFVFDNARVKDFNLFDGTRFKARYEHIVSLNEADQGFGKLSAELRHYQPLSREITLAFRGYGGHFVGENSPLFILGGMDNWLFNKTASSGSRDPFQAEESGTDNRNLLFHDFVTPMRGFSYNTFSGKNVLAASAELRIPIVRYFYRAPISSNFFRNLLAVGFFDIGSAWSGRAPFFRSNSINTEPVEAGGPFRAVINNFRNPWLSAYGVGLRTVLLGYYLKFDMAYPVEDYEIKKRRFYLTIGYDF